MTRRIVLSLLLLALTTIFVGSRYYPLIERIEIVGAAHRSPQEVADLAQVAYGQPLLWVTRGSVKNLTQDPWILSASVERRLPHTLRITVRERVPVATDGEQGYAIDGTVLKGVSDAQIADSVRLDGWGTSRLDEALELTELLADRDLKMISYTPAGFNLNFVNSTAFVPSVNALKTHWSSFASQQGTRAAVYPWGVSARYE